MKEGEIFRAPYFILDVSYDRLSLSGRLRNLLNIGKRPSEPGEALIETIERLRESMEARNTAYRELKAVNEELKRAKGQVEDHARNLEVKVMERTSELERAREELTRMNRDLESRVHRQVEELKSYGELRRYLSPSLAEKILECGHGLGQQPERKMMTVLFSDIRGFSALTDSLEPEEIFHLLDKYLSEMIRIIHRYEGTLNKIIGDGLLVFFGDPVPMEDHAPRAVLMSVDMQRRVRELKAEWLQYGHELGIGIGVNTGYMTVGSIGSEVHRDYTVIGNQVNVAARLESIAKPGQVLISARTYSRVSGLVTVEEVGEIRVKGFHRPIRTFNVITS
ncbi:MAG TPA: hypothetical protein ENO25_05875 [Desulfobacteraceae bacterium]|nr:hypothetical protein [Desulfobacteraceae bacterium]